MRKSHSYSKRELLDTCLRQFFYEYYAASKKLPFGLGTQATGTASEGVHRGLSARR